MEHYMGWKMTGIIKLVGTHHTFNVLGSILFKLFNKIDIYSLYALDRDKNVDFSKYQLPTLRMII